MRVCIFGASGRVGKLLVEAVHAAPNLDLAAAIVSSGSGSLAMNLPGGGDVYRDASILAELDCDVIVDFSTPAAAVGLHDTLGKRNVAVVVGTTGFDDLQGAAVRQASKVRPVLVSANFGLGFQAFLKAVSTFAAAEPGSDALVGEIYHARKKAAASGTSLTLRQTVNTVRGGSAETLDSIPIYVVREGDTVGVNSVAFDLGAVEIDIRYTVRSLASYAEGALVAARWVQGKGKGLYSMEDVLAG
jgi:4-hydroxy-tetrahydrodipicolinate reductase